MKLENENGFIQLSIEENEIIIEMIEVKEKRKGHGSELIGIAKKIADEKKLPLTCCAYTDDENVISQENLINFFNKNGFDFDKDDVNYTLMTWARWWY